MNLKTPNLPAVAHRFVGVLALVILAGSTGWMSPTADAVPPIPQSNTPQATGNETEKPDPEARSKVESPRATLKTLFNAFPKDAPDQIAKSFGCFPEAALPPTMTVRQVTIRELVRILDWLGWRDPAMIAQVPDSVPEDAPGTFTLLPWSGGPDELTTRRSDQLMKLVGDSGAIELRRGSNDGWRFNPETLSPDLLDEMRDAIRNIQNQTGEKPDSIDGLEDWIVSQDIPWLTSKVAFIEIWQWFGLGSIILIGLIVDLVVRLIGSRGIGHLARRIHKPTEGITIRRAVRGLGLTSSTATWLLLLPMLDLPLVAFGVLQPAAKFAFILALFWWGWRMTDLAGEIMVGRAKLSQTKADDILVPMVRKTLKVLLVAFVLVNLAPMLGLNLGPLLAAIGVGSFGFAFAFKNSLENLFGSVTVILDRPFQVGDWIIVDGIEGTVETVGIRSTRIRTFYNSLVSLPNSNLVTSKVDNYGLRKYRRWKSTIGILYGTPVPRIEAFCEGIREIVREHPYTRKDYYQVWVNEFGPSSIDILVYVFWETPDWQTELRERHRFMIDIMRLAGILGVDFAFPSQTIYLERGEGRAAPRDETLDATADPRMAFRKGRNAVREMTRDESWRQEKLHKYRFLDAEETMKLDSIDDVDHADRIESRLERHERTDLPPETGQDPDRPDFTEQRDAGG
ncbi:MAG: hypothetical protein CMJ34_05445 [Phycisphaerae bacterium]|nr:hypothetical protein [Phycisphaerae bacterium]